uniref:Uncharacterized protein n=1 Tax=Oryza glumipatula TaxID=40148 RepID=A0A0E0AN41_9ORYZ
MAAAAAAAAAASTARGGHRPWTAASRGVSARRCSVAPAQVRARGPTEWWPAAARRRRAPRRHAVAAKAGAADARPSSSSDAVSYSSSISTDMPLYEPTGVSFDEYLLDRARVFRAMFPDESRSQRLSDEEWRVQMLPLQFLLLTVHPVVVMQLRHRDGVLDLRIQPVNRVRAMCLFVCLFGPEGAAQTEWELRGLERDYAPASFDLGVRGSLYADRSRGRRACRLRGHLEISIGCVLQRLAEKMKQDVDVGIVADFQRFRREKAAAAAAATGKRTRERKIGDASSSAQSARRAPDMTLSAASKGVSAPPGLPVPGNVGDDPLPNPGVNGPTADGAFAAGVVPPAMELPMCYYVSETEQMVDRFLQTFRECCPRERGKMLTFLRRRIALNLKPRKN